MVLSKLFRLNRIQSSIFLSPEFALTYAAFENALMIPIYSGHLNTVQMLLRNRADVYAQDDQGRGRAGGPPCVQSIGLSQLC